MQTAVLANNVAAIEGMVANSSSNNEIQAAIAATAIPFGRFVNITTPSDGSSTQKVSLVDATGDITGVSALGVAIADTAREAAAGGYAIAEVVPVLVKGEIWVRAEDAVTAPAAAWVRFTAGATVYTIGRFRTDVDTDKAVALPGARFMTSCGAGELTLLRFGYQD